MATTPSGGLFVSSFRRYVWTVGTTPLVPQRLVDLRRAAEAIAVGAGSLWIASPAGERGRNDYRVFRFDDCTARIADRIPVGATPLFITFAFRRLWVSNYDGD